MITTNVLLAINWSNALIVAAVGFSLVIMLLIVLVLVLLVFGWFFTRKKSNAAPQQAPVVGTEVKASQFLTEEELAAVAAALNSCFYEVHDMEDLTITINHNDHGGDWSSKYSILTQ